MLFVSLWCQFLRHLLSNLIEVGLLKWKFRHLETSMQYPLELTFKIWTFAPKFTVKDAQGQVIFSVKQKLFKLKENIVVYQDEAQTIPLYDIKADRIIDFSARYNFSDQSGVNIGGVKRRGLRSIWRARYDIFDGDTPNLLIQEVNPWVKVLDALFSEIPVIGMFSGYVFNPSYTVSRGEGGDVVMRLEKRPGFLSRIFTVKKVDQMSEREEIQALMSLIMMILLERSRG